MRSIHRAVRKHGVQEGSWFVVVQHTSLQATSKVPGDGCRGTFSTLWLTSLTFTPMFSSTMKRQQSPAFMQIGGVIQQVDGQRFCLRYNPLQPAVFRFFVTFSSSQTILAESQFLRHRYTVSVTIGRHVALHAFTLLTMISRSIPSFSAVRTRTSLNGGFWLLIS